LRTRSHIRTYWLKQLHKWHWISSAACLAGMLLFAITGITLNHAASMEGKPQVHTRDAQLPAELFAQLRAGPDTPAGLIDWIEREFDADTGRASVERSAGEVYVALPRPGGDAWASIELDTGRASYELTDRGWISYLNDLHKGRNTGGAWSWFIDIFAVACLIFCATGLILLQLHARHRPATWPMVGVGVALPLLLAILFIH
jgi:uncharacterized protein